MGVKVRAGSRTANGGFVLGQRDDAGGLFVDGLQDIERLSTNGELGMAKIGQPDADNLCEAERGGRASAYGISNHLEEARVAGIKFPACDERPPDALIEEQFVGTVVA